MLSSTTLPQTAVRFTPFIASERYKCNTFVSEQIEDQFMSRFYSSINWFIRLISRRFNHERLFTSNDLKGDLSSMKNLLEQKYFTVLEHEQWLLAVAGSVVILTVLFTFFYIIYSCWRWCSYRKKKRDMMDAKYDVYKRNVLNLIIGIFVFIDVFAAVTLLISSHYAQNGADELPHRLGQCLDDASSYRRETTQRVKALFIDDFVTLEKYMLEMYNKSGVYIIENLKKTTGACAIDSLINITESASAASRLSNDAEQTLVLLNGKLTKLRNDLSKVNKAAATELQSCIRNFNVTSTPICQKAEELLKNISAFPVSIKGEIVSKAMKEMLSSVFGLNIESDFRQAIDKFSALEEQLQLDSKGQLLRKWIGNVKEELFLIAEELTRKLSLSDLNPFYGFLNGVNDKGSLYRVVVRYSWYGVLIVSGFFALVALYFLLAWCYGCFGNRPTYYEDDCCVRTTGTKLFSCGGWISLTFLGFLSLVTAVLLLFGGNVSNLICHPLANPLSRKDMLTFGKRLLDTYMTKNDFAYADVSLSEFIQACHNNKTLYTILNLDKHYGLHDFGSAENFRNLEGVLEQVVPYSGITSINLTLLTERETERVTAMQQSITAVSEPQGQNYADFVQQRIATNFTERFKLFADNFSKYSQLPREVSELMSQLKSLEEGSAADYHHTFDKFLEEIREINEYIARVRSPIDNAVAKLQHAQALLDSGLSKQINLAVDSLRHAFLDAVHQYIMHVNHSLQTDITSCAPLADIARGTTAALCTYTLDPFNGIWAAMLISIVCIILIITLSACTTPLYQKTHSYPKYIVHEPNDGGHMNAFVTDTYVS